VFGGAGFDMSTVVHHGGCGSHQHGYHGKMVV